MKHSLKLIALLFFAGISATYAQSFNENDVLITIDNTRVTAGEFVRIYKKNNTKDNQIDNKSVNDYLDLFINFKLKVIEAESMGLDTLPAFRSELAGYRKQLATPYLVDKDVDDKLLKEAYDRKKEAVRASHILIKVSDAAAPADTMVAYNKVMDIRKKAMAGEDFGKLAEQYSEDETTKVMGGDISYFSALSTVYPFENAAYNLKIGEVSMPVRSNFGYHLIKVTDRLKNPGEVKVAHIMVTLPKDAKEEDKLKAENKIKDVYSKLKAGEDFAKLAQDYSDDKSSARKGGELPWFGVGRMVPEFELAAFALANNGDYSKPVRTAFGWHIIKRVDARPIGSFDDLKSDLQTKISKDSRAQQSRSVLIEKLKKDYKYTLNEKQLAEFFAVADTNLYNGNWKAEKAAKLVKPLFTLGDSTYNQQAFAKFLESARKKANGDKNASLKLSDFVTQQFKKFSDDKIIAYEEARLDAKYPPFHYLMNEYHDGILLFDLTDKMVWSKAVKDTLGLQDFYQKNKSKYMWDKRADVTMYTYSEDKTKENAIKALPKKVQKKMSDKDFVRLVCGKDSASFAMKENKLFSKGDNSDIDKQLFDKIAKEGDYWVPAEGKELFVFNKMIEPMPKSLQESRGLVTADYQNFLEQTWVESLKAKHKITVDKKVLSTIK